MAVMSDPAPHDPNCRCHLADEPVVGARAARRWSRRGLLTAAASVGVGAFGLSRVGPVGAVDRPRRLVQASQALVPAARVDYMAPVPFEPPEQGRILFPIVVEEGDRCGVLDNFGDTRGRPPPYYHQGVDIMADEGLPIRAVVDGILTRRSRTDFYGWTLYDPADDVVYRYFHNTADANLFEEGDKVRQGDIIGFVGDTGTSPGNFHLHFEYRPGNVPADGYDLLQRVDHVEFW